MNVEVLLVFLRRHTQRSLSVLMAQSRVGGGEYRKLSKESSRRLFTSGSSSRGTDDSTASRGTDPTASRGADKPILRAAASAPRRMEASAAADSGELVVPPPCVCAAMATSCDGWPAAAASLPHGKRSSSKVLASASPFTSTGWESHGEGTGAAAAHCLRGWICPPNCSLGRRRSNLNERLLNSCVGSEHPPA